MLDKYYRFLRFISIVLGITVILDTFCLKQFLKNIMVKANTSSYSPYNTDGVFNIIIIFALVIAIPFIVKVIENIPDSVLIRKDGQHYHISNNCLFVDNDYYAIRKNKAIEKGFILCPLCKANLIKEQEKIGKQNDWNK